MPWQSFNTYFKTLCLIALHLGLLEKTPAEANAFLAKPEEYKSAMKSAGDAQARELLERVVECLVTERCTTFEDCITWARTKYVVLCPFFMCLNIH